jgi:hypothetical protein
MYLYTFLGYFFISKCPENDQKVQKWMAHRLPRQTIFHPSKKKKIEHIIL